MATHEVVHRKLDEAVNIFIEEFDRLQRFAPTATEPRTALLNLAGANFPESDVWELEPLFRKGCQDPNPEVRRSAMGFVTRYLGTASTNVLEDIAQHSRPEVRGDVLQYLKKLAEETKK